MSQPTSDHGWDFRAQDNYLRPIVARLKRGGMRVSLFADPDPAVAQRAFAAMMEMTRIDIAAIEAARRG